MRMATIPIGSVGPIESLFWVLCAVEIHPPGTQTADCSSSSALRIEWWKKASDYLKETTGFLVGAAENGHTDVLGWWMRSWPNQDHLPTEEDIQWSIFRAGVTGGSTRFPHFVENSVELTTAAERHHAEPLGWLVEKGGLDKRLVLMPDFNCRCLPAGMAAREEDGGRQSELGGQLVYLRNTPHAANFQ
ncbi:hypothetical protein DFJ73DRAFT_958985 [Zopfochytrium polystomum]|nr:hypothetical protein DFJ73DRAFT_964207 [Zopfochytrium polystomum]KAI9354288.1 hypothetical protein DFJ73DRAFT_958985 [Zopfochytrium polystomum]